MRQYVGMTKDESQRSRWTFYEVVNLGRRKLTKKGKLLFILVLVYSLLGGTVAFGGMVSLDGTMWMYEHESGAKHYIAFYGNFHYLNSSGFGQDEPDSMWLKSTLPYRSHINPNGSIIYSATHVASAAWSLNWGICNIDDEQASFNALGMIYNFFMYNRNEPYVLVSSDWHPPLLNAGSKISESSFIGHTLLIMLGLI